MFQGIFPALVTPFDRADQSLNGKAMAQLVKGLLEQGVNGFYVNGSTAEAFMMTESERKQSLETVLEANAGRKPVIANVSSFSTRDAIRMAKHAKEAGAQAISSVPPFYYSFSEDELVDYYLEVAYQSDMSMIVYNIPSLSGVALSGKAFEKLLSIDQIVGVKHTSYDLFMLEKLITKYPDKAVFVGHDEVLLSGIAAGARAAIGSTFNFMAGKFLRIMELAQAGHFDQALELQQQANRIIEVLSSVGVFKGVKAALEMQGLDCGDCRKPFAPLNDGQKDALREALKHNGSL